MKKFFLSGLYIILTVCFLVISINDANCFVSKNFGINVKVGPFPPKISYIENIITQEDTAIQPINITLADLDTELDAIQMFAESSNQTIVLNSNIVISGTGGSRTIAITPCANEYGFLTITIAAIDDLHTSIRKFTLEIIEENDAPKLSKIPDQFSDEDTIVHSIPITVTDVDTEPIDFSLFAQSSNQTIVPNNNIQILGSGNNRLIEITPVADEFGSLSITIAASDGMLTDIETFTFTMSRAKYLIKTLAEGAGSITPTNPVVFKNDQITLRMKPVIGNVVKEVWIDGKLKAAMPRFIFYAVKEPHTLTVLFGPPDKYLITSEVETGGTINPSGNVEVNAGANQLYIISSNIGYELEDVKINSLSKGPVPIYQFQNINKDQLIQVYFREVNSPTADFSVNYTIGTVPLNIEFYDNSLVNNDYPGDEINSWLWDFGDNTPKSSSKYPVHQYTDPGQYTVTLTVTGMGGLTDTVIKSDNIIVQPETIYLNFYADKTKIKKGEIVNFDCNSNIISNATYLWHFGDGSTSSDKTTSHLYSTAGNYTVSLTLTTGANSKTKQKLSYIKVSGRQISGKVLAGDSNGINTGVPLEKAMIELWLSSNEPAAFTLTDQNGNYTINGLPATKGYVMHIYPPFGNNNFFDQYYNKKQSYDYADTISTLNADVSNLDIVLRKTPQLGVKGRIHNGVSGYSNFEVIAISESAGFFIAFATTDESGYYTITGLKDANDYRIYVFHNNAEYYYSIPKTQQPTLYIPVCGDSVNKWEKAAQVTPTESPLAENIDIVLCSEGSIKGHVYNSDHIPVRGIWVNARSEELDKENGNFTDENGQYTITGLTVVSEPELLTKGYIVEVPSIQYPYQAYNQVSVENQASRISADNSTNINFYLKKSSSISGIVSDKYGIPVPNVNITAYSYSSPALKQGFATSDTDGNYTITNLPFARDYIAASFSDYYPPQYYYLKTKDEKDSASLISLENGDVDSINFMLDEGGIIKGQVKINNNGNIINAANIWVDIRSKSTSSEGGMIQTDSNGSFELTGLDETINDYIIKVDLSGYQSAYYNSTRPNTTVYTWDEAEGIAPSTDDVRNILIVEGFKITGKVTYEGSPANGILVIAYSDKGASGSAVTNKNNNYNYEITGLPTGKYTVFISSNTYIDSTIENIMLYNDVSDVNFSLEVPERQICGIIHGLEQDKKVNILVFTTEGNDSQIHEIIGDGSDKQYTVTGLKNYSDYRMQIYSNDYPDQIYNEKTSILDADIIDLSTINATGIDITLTSDVATIAGEVTFPSVAEYGDKAWVDIVSESTGSQGGAEVQKTVVSSEPFADSYTITGLEKAPDYRVHVWSDKYLTQYYNDVYNSDDANLIDTSITAKIYNVNFTLDPGKVISGKILDEYLKGVKDVYVEAASDSSSSVRSSLSLNDGTYIIKGLSSANDFKIKAMKPNVDVPFFFGTAGTVRDRKLASSVSTLIEDQENVNITLSDGLSIAGTIRDENNHTILNEKMWISVTSDTLQVDVGQYANSDGTYSIHGLPSGNDYGIIVQPDYKSTYIGTSKTNISSGSSNVDFYLTSGKKIEGYVKNSSGTAIRNVRIDICSNTSNIGKWTMTNTKGGYTISGLPPGDDYILTAAPPDNSDYVEVTEYDLIIQQDTRKNITLTPAMKFTGYVYKEDSTTPIKGAWVSVFSKESSGFMKGENTSSKGYFEINNIPDSSDYVISVSASGYQSQELTDQSPGGDDIVFSLKEAGVIIGTVKDTNGQAISNARVVARSSQISNVYVVDTDSNGSFTLKGLKSNDNFGNPITNYIVNVEKAGYMSQSKGQIKPGDEINFKLSLGGKIDGTIYDENNDLPPGNFTITVYAFEKLSDDELQNPIKTSADANGNFSLAGLDTSIEYVLQFKSSSTGNLIKKIQWYGAAGFGVKKFNGDGSLEDGPAISIIPDDTIDFIFRGTWE